jgi:hypothetical protein
MEYVYLITESEDEKTIKDFDDFDPFGHVKTPESVSPENLLHITRNNKKLKHPFLSLPAGYSCPAAQDCKSVASRRGTVFKSTGKKIQDFGSFRCYSASAEVQYEDTREIRWKNYDLLLKCRADVDKMVELIKESLDYSIRKKGIFGTFRIHADGDFFAQTYFDAWLKVVESYPKVNFYAYTKSLPFWIRRIDNIPSNLNLIASYGGKFDDKIEEYGLRNAVVVDTVEEAKRLRRRIDVDDSLAYGSTENFALLLHGGQKAGTERAKQTLKNAELMRTIKGE